MEALSSEAWYGQCLSLIDSRQKVGVPSDPAHAISAAAHGGQQANFPLGTQLARKAQLQMAPQMHNTLVLNLLGLLSQDW
jgi:hypothetical protein